MLRNNILRAFNWKHALGEILLIFIGITIAIWFNNWNESQKAKEVEIKSLIELKGAIGQDLDDIAGNIGGFSNRVKLYRMIIDHIEIINNDKIRNDISVYYDLEYERIQTDEQQHHDHFNNYLKPILLTHFNFSKPKLLPNDYDKLMKNFEFKQNIYWALRTDNYMLNNYKLMHKKANKLIEDLSEEIESLN